MPEACYAWSMRKLQQPPALPSKQWQPLGRAFYLPSADKVAPELLGHYLIRNRPQGPSGGLIVEVEAYLANDPACHAFGGETARNRTMFGLHGHAYVYLIYGMHYCVNAVCQPKGTGEAVLVRAIEVGLGEDLMRQLRAVKEARQLTNGPAKLCQALEIDRALDGVDLCDAASPLFVAENPQRKHWLQKRGPVTTSTRIGIVKAAHLPLRFYVADSPFISKRGLHAQ